MDEASAGAEIIIARAGRPVARLVPLEPPPARRVLGRLAGRLAVPDDFDAPLPEEVLTAFDGG